MTARKYWNQLKRRLFNEGSQLGTACHQLKMPAADGKQRLADIATAETLLRLVQSIPSPKAEPIKRWLAKVGHERMQEMADPALSLDRAVPSVSIHRRPRGVWAYMLALRAFLRWPSWQSCHPLQGDPHAPNRHP